MDGHKVIRRITKEDEDRLGVPRVRDGGIGYWVRVRVSEGNQHDELQQSAAAANTL